MFGLVGWSVFDMFEIVEVGFRWNWGLGLFFILKFMGFVNGIFFG